MVSFRHTSTRKQTRKLVAKGTRSHSSCDSEGLPPPSTQSLTFKAYELRAIVVDGGSNGPSAGQVLYSCDGRETRCLFGQCFILPIADLSRTKRKWKENSSHDSGVLAPCAREVGIMPSRLHAQCLKLLWSHAAAFTDATRESSQWGKGPAEIKPPPPKYSIPLLWMPRANCMQGRRRDIKAGRDGQARTLQEPLQRQQRRQAEGGLSHYWGKKGRSFQEHF